MFRSQLQPTPTLRPEPICLCSLGSVVGYCHSVVLAVQLPTPILCHLHWAQDWLPLFPYRDEAKRRSMNEFSTQVQVPTSRATRTSTRPARRPTPSPVAPTYLRIKLKSQAQGRIHRKR